MYMESLTELKYEIDKMVNEFITQKEYDELYASIEELFNDYIQNNIILYSKKDFHDTMYFDVKELVYLQLEDLQMDNSLYIFDIIYENVKKKYFKYIVPPRSYDKTFIRKPPNMEVINRKIKKIVETPQPTQRTKEWYEFRHNLITASSAWKALDTQSSKNSIIYEKCCPHDYSKYDNVNLESPFHWGTKYEPISIQIYEDMYNTKIDDYGCIKHETFSFLGASPDGINTDVHSQLYGRMLEIKNIVNREINGIPKPEYWIQMQLQMEVCDLNECDFLETQFKEYKNYLEFKTDGEFKLSSDGCRKGCFVLFMDNGYPYYEYPNINMDEEEFDAWKVNIIEKNNHMEWVKDIYWKLEILSCVLVLRNKLWFNSAIKEIESVWNTICHEKINGYIHRAPKKREKKEVFKKRKCLLHFSDNKVSINEIIKIDTQPL